MEHGKGAALQEWRGSWPLVAAATAGFSFATIAAASIGLFMEPLSAEFGWSRAEIAIGMTMYALIAVPLSPIVGAMIDRWGPRRLAIPGLILSAAAFAAFSLLNGSLVQWLGLWLVYSAVALGVKGTVWTAAISSVFSAGRGLALAVTLSGSALAMTFVPPSAQWLIDNLGWRSAYAWLGFGWGLFVLALLVPFFFGANDRRRAEPRADEPAAGYKPSHTRYADIPGLSVAEALRSRALLTIGAATLMTFVVVSAVSVHQVPMLTAQGLSRQSAAFVAASSGVASIVGKLATGWMLDRWQGRWIGAVSLMLPALSYLILIAPLSSLPLSVVAIVLIGYSNGAFVQISAYMTGRYGGLKNFGKIYGTIMSVSALAAGIGPVLAGLIYDRAGTYWPLLAAGVPLAILSGVLVLGIGSYPDWQAKAARSTRGC